MNYDILYQITLFSYRHGKDAHGDVLRGLQVVETACGITSTLLGEKIEVSKDMDTETRRVPLGVCARYVFYYI